mmetsp:Transcript_105828/g.207575  ORF Transcript_105828/g.207575 Transcript_105828/m.207575 type:complete len:200 (-) Transcript_105828:976-1575(-)
MEVIHDSGRHSSQLDIIPSNFVNSKKKVQCTPESNSIVRQLVSSSWLNVSKLAVTDYTDIASRCEKYIRRKDRLSCVALGEFMNDMFSCIRNDFFSGFMSIKLILQWMDLSAHLIRFDWLFEAYFFYDLALQRVIDMSLDTSRNVTDRNVVHNLLLAMAKLLKVSRINGDNPDKYNARANEIIGFLISEYKSSEAKDYL